MAPERDSRSLRTAGRLASATAMISDTPWKRGWLQTDAELADRTRPWMPKASAKYAMSVPQTFGRRESCEAPRNTAATAGNR